MFPLCGSIPHYCLIFDGWVYPWWYRYLSVGCPHRFTNSIQIVHRIIWYYTYRDEVFLAILGTFFFRHATTFLGSLVPPASPKTLARRACERCLRERAAMVLGIGFSSFDAGEDGGQSRHVTMAISLRLGCWGVVYASTVYRYRYTISLLFWALMCFEYRLIMIMIRILW